MSDKKSHIDKIIKEGFEGDSSGFDMSSWDNLANGLDKSTTVDKEVLGAFDVKPEQLDASSWEAINDALDIDTVWKRLEDRPKRKPFIFWWKFAGVFLLLIGGTFALFNAFDFDNSATQSRKADNFELNAENSLYRQNNNESIGTGAENNQIYENQLSRSVKGSNQKQQQQKQKSSTVLTKDNQSQNDDKEDGSTIIHNSSSQDHTIIDDLILEHSQDKNTDIAKIPTLEITPLDYQLSTTLSQLLSIPIDITPHPIKKTKFEIGLIGTIDNSWILDANTREGFDKNSLVFNNWSLTPSYGLYLNYTLPKKYVITTEFFINSSLRTENNLYVKGNLIEKETRFDYYKASFLLGKELPLKKRALLFNIGPYVSFLKTSELLVNNTITNINTGHSRFDYGIKFEVGQKWEFGKFVLNYGIHSDIGLKNVFLGDQILPAKFNRTRNISSGAFIRIGYQF